MRACCHRVCHPFCDFTFKLCLLSWLPGASHASYLNCAMFTTCGLSGCLLRGCVHAQPDCALYSDGGGDVHLSLSAQGSQAGRCLQAHLQQPLQLQQAKLLQPPRPQPLQQASHCPCMLARSQLVSTSRTMHRLSVANPDRP